MAESARRRPVRKMTRKRKGGKNPTAPAPSLSSNQSASVEIKDPTIELNEVPTGDQGYSAGNYYVTPKLPLSALDVPGPAGELSIPALRRTKRLVHHCKYPPLVWYAVVISELYILCSIHGRILTKFIRYNSLCEK
jgi:hypothetical protein